MASFTAYPFLLMTFYSFSVVSTRDFVSFYPPFRRLNFNFQMPKAEHVVAVATGLIVIRLMRFH